MNCCVAGQNNQAGKSILKTDYKDTNTVEENLKLAVKILLKTMDSTVASPERLEISVLRRLPDESTELVTLADADVKVLIDEIQAQQEAEQKERDAASGDL